mmetsp:Transcript_65075/g.136318  ORF Transcript_65075/g.136318 Transcript_65075/m.136318 type:complete len:125 (-) Transcript_65075:2541-2915(-)
MPLQSTKGKLVTGNSPYQAAKTEENKQWELRVLNFGTVGEKNEHRQRSDGTHDVKQLEKEDRLAMGGMQVVPGPPTQAPSLTTAQKSVAKMFVCSHARGPSTTPSRPDRLHSEQNAGMSPQSRL